MALESGFQPHKDYRGFVPASQFYAALIAKGFTPVAARGILGNAMHESGGGSRGVYLDPPTDAGHPNWGTGDAAVGAIQWEGKRQAGVSPTLQSQVDKIWDEFNDPAAMRLAGMSQGVFERLQSAQSPGEAAHLVNTVYERPLKPAASDAQRQRFANVSLNATPGTTLTSVPDGIVDPSIHAHGGTSPPIPESGYYTPATTIAAAPAAPPPTFGEAIGKGDVGGALRAINTPTTTKNADGTETQSKTPLEKIAGAFGGKDEGQGVPEIPALPTMTPVQDPNAGLAPAAQQLFQTVQANAAKPLSWNARPYGYNAGFQGTTLNQTGYQGNG